MRSNPEKYFAIILLCVFYCYRAVGLEIHDFANYYFGGHFLGHGNFSSETYYPYWFNKSITALGHEPIFGGFAPNSPFLALLFTPFSLLEIGIAKLTFNAISIFLFVLSIYRLAAHYKINAYYLLAIPVLFLVPIRNEILFGQVYFLLFFFLSESLLAYEKKQFVKMAVFLSLAILIKIFPLVLVLIFIFKSQFRPALYTVISSIVLVLLTLFFCDLQTWVFYVDTVLSKASSGGIASAYVDNYQSVLMFLRRLFVFDQVQNPDAMFNCPALFYGLNAAFKTALIAIGYYLTRKSDNLLLLFSYWILAAILMSPYGSTYTFILLLFPFFALIKSTVSNAVKAICCLSLLLINNLPLSLFLGSEFPVSYLRLFALLLFFAGFLAMIYKFANLKITLIVTAGCFCIAVFLKNGDTGTSRYFLADESPLLIYDYKIQNDKLTYYYWDSNGENDSAISISTKNVTRADLSQNNIYFYGKKIPSDSGNKLKPMVLDGKTLIYLSDHERGIGFYTLRAIDLNEINPQRNTKTANR